MVYIFGLPRSRTFWLSIFMDYDHEIPAGRDGLASTSYPLIKDWVKPEDKVVIIHRDIDEVAESLAGLFGDKNWAELLWPMALDLDRVDGLHIDYEEIDERLQEIWNYCRDDPFPEKLAEQMKPIVMNNTKLIGEVRQCL